MPDSQTFRANVGIAVLNERRDVLAFERWPAGSNRWQLPQGGLKIGEEPRAAAVRELREEVGLGENDYTFVAEYPHWLAYEWPAELRRDGVRRGQVQRWFFVRLHPTAVIDPAAGARASGEPQELCGWKWMRLAALAELSWPQRTPIYAALAEFVDRL